MSRLDKLITQYCPSGVPRAALRDVAEIRSGWGFPRADQGVAEGKYPFYKVSDMNLPGNALLMTQANNYVDAETVRRLGASPAPAGTVVFPKIGAAVATNKKRLLAVDAAYDNNVMGLIPGGQLTSRYLLYWMQTLDLASVSNDSGAVPSIRKSEMESVRIPVPPLEVQQEIVRILDHFTELESELESELEARRRQYAHYRHQWVRTHDAAPDLVVHLGDLVSFGGRGTDPKRMTEPEVQVFSLPSFDRACGPEISTPANVGSSKSRISQPCVLIAKLNPHIPRIWRVPSVEQGMYASPEFYQLVPSPELSLGFLHHFLSASIGQLAGMVTGSTNSHKRLQREHIQSLEIVLPGAEEQHRIVDILDKFDALVNHPSVGLPAELAARRKQYEYYRDRLLTFKELQA